MKSVLRTSEVKDRPVDPVVDEHLSPEGEPAEKSSTPTPPPPTRPAIFSRKPEQPPIAIQLTPSASDALPSTRTDSRSAEPEKSTLKPIGEPKLVEGELNRSGNPAAFSPASPIIVDAFSAALTDAHWSGNLSAPSAQKIGSSNEEGGEGNLQEDIDRLREAAEQGDARAQFNLALMYDLGPGVEQDFGQALHWYGKAAQQGVANAQCKLGQMFKRGNGVEKNLQIAVHWFSMAANQGHAVAQRRLGGMYYRGKGVAKDLEQAAHWYGKAAEQGDARAQFSLGSRYLYGEGVKENVDLALEWLGAAAK